MQSCKEAIQIATLPQKLLISYISNWHTCNDDKYTSFSVFLNVFIPLVLFYSFQFHFHLSIFFDDTFTGYVQNKIKLCNAYSLSSKGSSLVFMSLDVLSSIC